MTLQNPVVDFMSTFKNIGAHLNIDPHTKTLIITASQSLVIKTARFLMSYSVITYTSNKELSIMV